MSAAAREAQRDRVRLDMWAMARYGKAYDALDEWQQKDIARSLREERLSLPTALRPRWRQ